MDEKTFLENYSDDKYKKPSVTADINIFSVFEEETDNYRKLPNKYLKLLLVKRREYPYKEMYALPGGFVRDCETVDSAAQRELLEETGIKCDFLRQLKVFSEPLRDPRKWVITCSYIALIDSSKYLIQAGSDAITAEWFDVSWNETSDSPSSEYKYWELKLNNGTRTLSALVRQEIVLGYDDEYPELELVKSKEIAFDHALIISHAILHLRKMIKRTPIVFELLPEYFSLSEIQKVYEVILGEKLLTPAFRRYITPYVEEIGSYSQPTGHRPSKLYRKK